MKLYIKRIAQAALITSAVAVAGSAFAMASSNIPTNATQITIDTNASGNHINYRWAFTKKIKKSPQNNELYLDTADPYNDQKPFVGSLDGNIQQHQIPGDGDPQIAYADSVPHGVGVMVCPWNINPAALQWKPCSNIVHLINKDTYAVTTKGSVLRLKDTSKVIDINIYYQDEKGYMANVKPQLYTQIRKSLNKTPLLSFSMSSDDTDFTAEKINLSGPIKIDLPVIKLDSVRSCTPKKQAHSSDSFTYITNTDTNALQLKLNDGKSINQSMDLPNVTPTYAAEVVYDCEPNS